MEPLKDRQGKIVPGAFICSNAELQAPHYQALKNPSYRQELWNIYHEPEHEPSNAFLYGNEVKSPANVPRQPLKSGDRPAANQDMAQVKSLLIDLQNRLNKHIDLKKRPIKGNKVLKPIETK